MYAPIEARSHSVYVIPANAEASVSKYTPISQNEDYDWAIVPFEQFLNGFDSPTLAPLIGVAKLQRVIQNGTFDPLFSSVLTRANDGQTCPAGEWRTTIAARFDRTIYNLFIITTVDEDRMIVEAFNSAANKSRFNFFYENCTNQTKAILNLVLPEHDAIGDRVDGLTMEVPKGLAKTLVERALKHPELELRVERYTQLPGTFSRSRDVLFRAQRDGVPPAAFPLQPDGYDGGLFVTESGAAHLRATATQGPAGRDSTRTAIGPGDR